MIYTDSGRYAIRAVVYMAANAGDSELISAARIADAEEIPPFYLSKVLKDLARAGVLESVRGRGGGFRLSRPASEIRVLEVLQTAENPRTLTKDCLLGLADCSNEAPCPLHETWSSFRDTFLERIKELTVADLQRDLARKRAPTDRSANK